MYIIVIDLNDGLNYYCGKVLFQGAMLHSWDTDFRYCKTFLKYDDALEVYNELKAQQASKYCRIISKPNFVNNTKS